jgi:hypothetical protein
VGSVKSFRDLIAYTRARRLARLVYDFTKAFPKDEQYALTSQIRRAVYSVSLNIAEGYGIGTPQATLRYLRTLAAHSAKSARGSTSPKTWATPTRTMNSQTSSKKPPASSKASS